MTVKQKLIELFEKNKGTFLSGAEIAHSLSCTRGAVWKAVKSLQEDGYDITAVSGKGYRLEISTDVLSENGIKRYLSPQCAGLSVEVHKIINSTNTKLKELAADGAPEGTVVISGEQTNGKGRLGRSFFSPSDTGVYMSLLLRPQMTADSAVRITTAAAVAVAEAIEKLSGQSAEIKWVNDIYMNGKKVCGILTEAAFSLENGGLEYAVLGIGVNAYAPEKGFPEEIKDIAGAVFTERKDDMRNKLAAEILDRFMKYYCELADNTYIDGYRDRLMWKGKKINIISGNTSTPATLSDVDKDCRLLVEYENGERSAVSSGEISIRATSGTPGKV